MSINDEIDPQDPKKRKIDPKDVGHVIELYGIIFTKFNQEGDGIWSRLNIMVALNLIFFAGYGFIWSNRDHLRYEEYLLLLICIIGFVQSSYTLYALNKLWKWHDHWRDKLWKIEEDFPTDPGWVQPHSPIYDPDEKKSLFSKSTHPFIYIFIIIWLGLFVITIGYYFIKV